MELQEHSLNQFPSGLVAVDIHPSTNATGVTLEEGTEARPIAALIGTHQMLICGKNVRHDHLLH